MKKTMGPASRGRFRLMVDKYLIFIYSKGMGDKVAPGAAGWSGMGRHRGPCGIDDRQWKRGESHVGPRALMSHALLLNWTFALPSQLRDPKSTVSVHCSAVPNFP